MFIIKSILQKTWRAGTVNQSRYTTGIKRQDVEIWWDVAQDACQWPNDCTFQIRVEKTSSGLDNFYLDAIVLVSTTCIMMEKFMGFLCDFWILNSKRVPKVGALIRLLPCKWPSTNSFQRQVWMERRADGILTRCCKTSEDGPQCEIAIERASVAQNSK